MSLLIFTETVTMTNAVSFWSKLHQHGRHQGYYEEETQGHSKMARRRGVSIFAEALEIGTCLSPFDPSCWKRQADCCKDCSHCLDTRAKERVCSFPRGGHMHDHSHAHDAASALIATTPLGLPLNSWKVIFQALLTTMNVLCWLIPLKSKKISQNKFALSMANAFSGGVFLSLAFGHLIPECVHGFANLPEETPYLLVLAGYLLIFFVEKVAFDAHEILHEMQGEGHHHHHHSHNHQVVNTKDSKQEVTPAGSGRGAVILLGALAVHSVLEMMALGLANNFGDCALLTLSISLHQPAESIALLVAFLKSGMPEDQVLKYLSIFSCMGPIGVALGMAVSEYAAPIVDSIMLAVVAGTFVYVGATEVIPEEWEDGQHKWAKFAALMGGIGSILVITQYTASLGGHSH
ncbi:solute carrier family 39 (zinc transporter), member 1/2/3 [Fistulifera solaris]|uniref:Solute carrier family 39 (Zinc transporter), member 1/2/3 n=1 Tax=Fistulifera solaris TaxID=1519565 RepID=A0A1Z5KNV4_FISSO|nr:solute carrier family 39 (zinc transporter), member 1/2/3 [Fistulifera solaris]|eukprot:GAX27805.1 solute carrier family 39 (zinc transporter), member 1/2/3 [Fistulifera solaris]